MSQATGLTGVVDRPFPFSFVIKARHNILNKHTCICIPSTQSKTVRERMQTSHSGKIPLHKEKLHSVAPIISSNKAADCNFRKQHQVANRKIKAFYHLH